MNDFIETNKAVKALSNNQRDIKFVILGKSINLRMCFTQKTMSIANFFSEDPNINPPMRTISYSTRLKVVSYLKDNSFHRAPHPLKEQSTK